MPEITIREVIPDDIPAIKLITQKAWEGYFNVCRQRLGEKIYDVTRRGWETWKPDQVAMQCEPETNDCVLVAVIDGRVAGFATYILDAGRPGIGEISNNAVSPEFQSRGVGTALYVEVLDRMRKADMKVAKVFTGLDDSHIPARRAYEKLGFSRNLQSIEYFQTL